jgi:Asp-tRNA(Asn)/Glu-tRNA(Gln) amidotransferase A subunit family amidase
MTAPPRLPSEPGAGEIARRIRWRETSVVAVVEDHLARLASARDAIGGVAWSDDGAVLAAARVSDRVLADNGTAIGPLHGVPITVKDWIDVAGFPCAGESARHRDRRPTEDATVVARLRAAGAIVIAKTAARDRSDIYGITRNPHDPARSPGATSSGEGALVGAGASPLGIGSDSGGSVRLPAAWCGIAGRNRRRDEFPTPVIFLASEHSTTAAPRSGRSLAASKISRSRSR